MDDYEVRINATRAQIEDLKESILWQDIQNELDFWVGGLEKEDESLVDKIIRNNMSTAASLTMLGNIDGRREAIRYFKQILDVFLGILEERKDDSKRKRADGSEINE